MDKILDKKLISIVVPVFNEEKYTFLFYEKLEDIWSNKIPSYDYEVIFVNDGSADQSEKIIDELSEGDKKIKLISFSRNFGKEIATTAGLHHCRQADQSNLPLHRRRVRGKQ